jgi:hypothetical protein
MQVLPKVGFSSPITETVLPQAFTGTCTGTWTTLPESTPGVHSGALRTGVGGGDTRTREHETTGGSNSGDDLLDHYSSS